MNFPLLDSFLTMLWFFLWVMWLFLLFRVVLEISVTTRCAAG